MTYTLFMPADQRIKIAEDGVAEVPMTDARAALTSLIREVSWGGKPGAFTERGKRVAVVVQPDFYNQAVIDRAIRVAALQVIAELDEPARTPAMRQLGDLVAKSFGT